MAGGTDPVQRPEGMDDKTTGRSVYTGGENNRKVMVQDRKKGRRENDLQNKKMGSGGCG